MLFQNLFYTQFQDKSSQFYSNRGANTAIQCKLEVNISVHIPDF